MNLMAVLKLCAFCMWCTSLLHSLLITQTSERKLSLRIKLEESCIMYDEKKDGCAKDKL